MQSSRYFNLSLRYILLLLLTSLIVGYILNIFHVSDWCISLFFVLIYFLGMCSLWNVDCRKVSLFFIFYASFGLFIGGSFFAVVLGYEGDPFLPTFFYDYTISYARRVEIVGYVIAFILFALLGYFTGKIHTSSFKSRLFFSSFDLPILQRILHAVFLLISILISCELIQRFQTVLSDGYLALYIAQQNESYAGSNILNIVFPLVFAMAITYGTRILKIEYIILFVLQGLLNILMGTRSAFGALLLILLWLYAKHHQISLKRIGIWCFFSLGLLLLIYSFSIRAEKQGRKDESVIEKMLYFSFSQGGSLMTFDASRLVNNYPIIPYFQSFVPAASSVYSLATGEELYHKDVGFSAHMNYELNYKLYYAGCGLGWSLLSDLYLFSGRTWIGFCLLSLICGWLLAVLDRKSAQIKFYQYISVAISYSLVLLPRGAISSIFPLIIYAVIFWFLILFCVQIRKYLLI